MWKRVSVCTAYALVCLPANPTQTNPVPHHKQDKAQIYFALPAKKMFGVDKVSPRGPQTVLDRPRQSDLTAPSSKTDRQYVPVLDAEAQARGVNRLFETVLVAVDGAKREATFRRGTRRRLCLLSVWACMRFMC